MYTFLDSARLRSQPLLEGVEVGSGVITLRPHYLWDPSAWYTSCSVRTDLGIPLPPLCTQGNQSIIVLHGLNIGGTYDIDVWAVTGAGATGGAAKALVVLRGKHISYKPCDSSIVYASDSGWHYSSLYSASLAVHCIQTMW